MYSCDDIERHISLRIDAERMSRLAVNIQEIDNVKVCTIDNCSSKAISKGLCNAHYLRMRKNKDLSYPVQRFNSTGKCTACSSDIGSKGGWGLCSNHYKKRRVHVIKSAVVDLMGGCCSRCKGIFPLGVYDFHHIDDKDGSISELMHNRSISALAKEISKCILLCANCHRIENVTSGEDLL